MTGTRPQIKKRNGNWSQNRGKKEKEKNENKKSKKKAKEPVQKTQQTNVKVKPKFSTSARSDDAIKVSARDVQSYAKKAGDVSAFQKALDRSVEERTNISALVSKRSLETRDLDETVGKEEFVATLCFSKGRPAFDGSCRLFTRFRGVKIAVIQLIEADALRLFQLEKNRIGWVECQIREHSEVARCFRYLGPYPRYG